MLLLLLLITIPVSNSHLFSDINISQGSVVTPLRCSGIFTYHITANLSLSLTMKEFWKSVKIWQSYLHEFGGPVCFLEHSVVHTHGHHQLGHWQYFGKRQTRQWHSVVTAGSTKYRHHTTALWLMPTLTGGWLRRTKIILELWTYRLSDSQLSPCLHCKGHSKQYTEYMSILYCMLLHQQHKSSEGRGSSPIQTFLDQKITYTN